MISSPAETAERLGDDLPVSARFTVAISSASSAIFSSSGWSTGILRADRASARAEKSLILFQATPARPAWADAAFHR
jgi:hypothetical protein